MKKQKKKSDDMRVEYDFSKAERGNINSASQQLCRLQRGDNRKQGLGRREW
jgi:hypothetical protein